MKKIIIIVFIFLSFAVNAWAIQDIEMKIEKTENYLSVRGRIIASEEFIKDFQDGLTKNIFISIELLRKWSIIPDEFVAGVQIERVLVSDPIKEEFIIKEISEQTMTEKRFKNWQEALNWALRIEPVKIVNLKNVERGKYYMRITVESNIKKLPMVLEHLLFFIPRYDQKITKESESFRLP